MPKAPQEVTVNNHLSVNELIEMFKPGSSQYNTVKSNLHRAMIRYYKQKDLNPNGSLIEGHQYFACPITGLRFCEVSNNHFKRFGISKDRFIELFPEFSECTETPHAMEIRRNKAAIKNSAKPKDMKTIVDISFDLNELKKTITEKATKERFKEIDLAWKDAIEDYHYFVCPLTQRRILGFTAAYFNKLENIGLTEDTVRNEFPMVKWLKITPLIKYTILHIYINT